MKQDLLSRLTEDLELPGKSCPDRALWNWLGTAGYWSKITKESRNTAAAGLGPPSALAGSWSAGKTWNWPG